MPFLTQLDPDETREGSLDPMGLAPTADLLADGIAPNVTARMSRIRFLTAMSAGATLSEEVQHLIPADGVTPAYIAFEWLLVEALARQRQLPPAATRTVPDIGKFRSMLALDSGHPLNGAGYLKGPRVFGFNGVYKRLARGLDIVTPDLILRERGWVLVQTWEREVGLEGFGAQREGTGGGNLARAAVREMRAALMHGSAVASPRSPFWGTGYPLPSPWVGSLMGWLASIRGRGSSTRATGMSCCPGSLMTRRAWAIWSGCAGERGSRADSAERSMLGGGRWLTGCGAAERAGRRARSPRERSSRGLARRW